jgi:hypothetical protein
MGFWSGLKQLRRAVRQREFTDHPWGFPSQQQLENGPRYFPGGLDLSQYYSDSDEGDKRRPAE